jgi:hypothetical protein
MTALVLPSAQQSVERNGNMYRVQYSQISFACWNSMLMHSHYYYTVGQMSEAATKEACNHLGIDLPFIDTLSRGSVHHKSGDPLNGFLEYTGGMSYNIWPWKTVITWLTYGWPRPTHENADSPVGSWCWNNSTPRLIPEFDQNEHAQLKKMRVPMDVILGKRLMTESEAVDVACAALRKQRVKPRNKYFRR